MENCYTFREQPMSKKRKVTFCADVMVEIEDRDGNTVPIRALLDTGTTATILLRKFVRKGRAKSFKSHDTKWKTLGGEFVTNRKCLIDFKFPELSRNKAVTSICHVDHKRTQTRPNMI